MILIIKIPENVIIALGRVVSCVLKIKPEQKCAGGRVELQSKQETERDSKS